MMNLEKMPVQAFPDKVCRIFNWPFTGAYKFGRDDLAVEIIDPKTRKPMVRTLSYAYICNLLHWAGLKFDGDFIRVVQLSKAEKLAFVNQPVTKGKGIRVPGKAAESGPVPSEAA